MDKKKLLWWYLAGGFDSDFQNIVNRAIALGYTLPSASILTAMNNLYKAEKTFIQACNIYYVFANGGAAQNFALLNWAENANTFNADYPTAITYNTSGVRGNGTDQYISTNWNASTNGGSKYVLNSACRGGWIPSGLPSFPVIDGTLTTGSRNCMRQQSSTTLHKINQGSANLAGALDFSGTGYVALDRSSSTVVSGYNDLTKTDTTATSSAILNEEQTILKSGTAFGDVILANYFCGGSFSGALHNSHRNNLAAYITAIGL